jgi:hypothetical protein
MLWFWVLFTHLTVFFNVYHVVLLGQGEERLGSGKSSLEGLASTTPGLGEEDQDGFFIFVGKGQTFVKTGI